MRTIRLFSMVLVMVAGCSAEMAGSSSSAANGGAEGGQLGGLGGAEQLGTGGAGIAGLGGAGALQAAPTDACGVDQVAGTACADAFGYVYLPGDPAHWCVQCYEWTPPEVNPPVNAQAGCLGRLASDPAISVQCVSSCSACVRTCPPGVGCGQ